MANNVKKYIDKQLTNNIMKNLSYTTRDYDNILAELINVFIGDNAIASDWDNISSSDPLFIMLHLMAAHKDILNYQIDYSVLEGYMSTARERASLVRIANSYGYKIPSYKAGSAVFNYDEIQGEFPSPFTTVPFQTSVNNVPWSYLWKDDNKIETNEEEIITGGEIRLYQGYVEEAEINKSNVTTNNLTHILTNKRVAIGNTANSRATSRLVMGEEGNEVHYTEVDNIYRYVAEDGPDGKNYDVYELNVDTQDITYIKFHPDSSIRLNTSPDSGKISYLVTEGYRVNEANELKLETTSDTIRLKPIIESFSRGSDPATATEIRDGFSTYYNTTESLVLLDEYKAYIENQTINQTIDKVLVFDIDGNTSGSSNAAIGIEADKDDLFTYGIPEIKIALYPAQNTNILDKLEITKRKVTGVDIGLITSIDTPEIEVKITGIPAVNEAAIRAVITEYITSLNIAGTISIPDIYELILNTKGLGRLTGGLNVKVKIGDETDNNQLKYNQVAISEQITITFDQ